MGMKVSEVGAWLRQMAGKRDHRKALRDDYRVLRPGPNFDWFMEGLAAQPTAPAPEPDQADNDRHEDNPRREFFTVGSAQPLSALSAVRRRG